MPLHPNTISLLKLALVAPPALMTLPTVGLLPASPAVLLPVLFVFVLLDWLDGVVARERGLESRLGGFVDRATDAPLLLGLAALGGEVLPVSWVLSKVALDIGVMLASLAGRGSTENRARTSLSFLSLCALFGLAQGWAPALLTLTSAKAIVGASAALTLAVLLRQLGILRLRSLANALSLGNLACGLGMIAVAAAGSPQWALPLLALGAALDGFDGAAARRFGGTRWGVLMDDVADGITNGVAPGALIALTVGGVEGQVLGIGYALFTAGRLLYFTLQKDQADPAWFSGVPSTAGAFTVVSAAILLPAWPAALGAVVGLVAAEMVAFDTPYRHLGRALARFLSPARRTGAFAQARPAFRALLLSLPLALSAALWTLLGPAIVAAGVLLTNLGYALAPPVRHLLRGAAP